MTNYYTGKYTEEERRAIKAENCKTHGQRQQESEDYKEFTFKGGLIIFGIIAAIYFIMPIVEKVMLP